MHLLTYIPDRSISDCIQGGLLSEGHTPHRVLPLLSPTLTQLFGRIFSSRFRPTALRQPAPAHARRARGTFLQTPSNIILAKESIMLEVELDIFSGMPNPTWILSKRQEEALYELLSAEPAQI